MSDHYLHYSNNQLIYITECIPGPPEDTLAYRELIQSINSQLTDCCICLESCQPQTCACNKNSGGANYIKNAENGKLLLSDCKISDYVIHPIIECNDLCSCSKNCGNRIVQNGPFEGLYVKSCDNSDKGLGLFTMNSISAGTFICEYAGELITKHQANKRHTENLLKGKMNYIFCLNEHSGGGINQTFVDPTYFGNIGRYANHSCDPNGVIIPVRVNMPVPKLAIFSCRNIMAQEEITFEYGKNSYNELPECAERKKCLCNSYNCAGWMPYQVY